MELSQASRTLFRGSGARRGAEYDQRAIAAAHVKFILEHSSSKLLFHDATVRELALDAIGQLGSSQIQRIVMGEIILLSQKVARFEFENQLFEKIQGLAGRC